MDAITRKKLNALTGTNLRFFLYSHNMPKRFCQDAHAMGLGDAFELRRRRKAAAREANRVARASRKRNRAA